MKRRVNPFFIVYQLLIFYPLTVLITVLAAVVTIVFVPFVNDQKLINFPAVVWARFICKISFLRVKIAGTENFDPQKSYIFIANHQSVFDVFIIYGWLNSRFKWIMKKEIRKIPFVGKSCEKLGHIFIDRSSPLKAKKSIDKAESLLKNGASVVIFPEGHRTRDGKIQKFKRGAFFLATDLNLEVVPITLKGFYEAFPTGACFVKPGKIEMIIHKPLSTEGLTHENLQDFMEKTHKIIESAL